MEVAGSSIVMLITCLFGLIALLGTAFWIWMLVDCAKNEPDNSNEKIVWILIIVLTHLVGAAIYYFVRRPARISTIGH